MITYILNDIDHEWVGSETDQESKRDLLMTPSYICVTYGYSLIGYEGLWVDSQRFMDSIHLVKHYKRDPHVLLAVIGSFEVDDGNRMHVLPLVNLISSGTRIHIFGWRG